MVRLLFTVMQSLARDWAEQSAEYFLLLTRLLSYLSELSSATAARYSPLTTDTLTIAR